MKLGIIGAMESEVAAIKEKMNITKTVTKAGMEFAEGMIGKTECAVVRCGVGKVNAGMCVQILCDAFGADAILNTGVAGSLNNDINVGDFVVASSVVYHDVDATNFGYALGEIPAMGMKDFIPDADLAARAETAIRKAAGVDVFRGPIASGDQFICTTEKKHWIKEHFHAYACDMESTAIGHAASLNNIPFVIIRAISDKADEETLITYDQFEKKAGEDCANTVYSFVESL